MPEKGYKVVSIRKEIANEIRKRAKEDKRTISVYLAELLESEGKKKGKEGILSKVFKSNGLTKEDLRTVLKEEGYSKSSTVTDKELSDKDIKKIAGQMELAIGMYIESGVTKAVKSLR